MTKTKDLIIGVSTTLFAVVNFSYFMPKFVGKIGIQETYFPIFTTSVLLILGVLLIVSAVFKKPSEDVQKSDEETVSENTTRGKMIFSMLITFVYCFFMEKIGFIVLTPICMVATWLVFEVRSWKVIVFTTIILILAVYFLFEFGLRAQLPQWHL